MRKIQNYLRFLETSKTSFLDVDVMLWLQWSQLKELTALWVVVASTKNILSTISCCSFRATLKKFIISYLILPIHFIMSIVLLTFAFKVFALFVILVFTSRVSASNENRRSRTNFRGEDRICPVSPEKKLNWKQISLKFLAVEHLTRGGT